ncbi:MAG: hypothetical protein K8J31_02135 [Anaerolineae bacterium]|nr:hypothetical protein [Anaerolineae bacterium]
MPDCYLTDRQKDLLRSLVPGLEDGTVATEWSYAYGGGEILGIFGLDDQGELWRNVWKGVTRADFDEFVACGFFRMKADGGYIVRSQMIIDAVARNFGEIDANQPQVNQSGEITVIPIFGPAVTSKQFQCDVFMVMPFVLRSIFENPIKPLVQSLGMDIKLGDDFFSKHDIIREIWSAIYHSKFIIADCTGRNPNVFYELGIAHTLGKPAIMITQNKEDIPFDVQAKRYILYGNTPEGLRQLEKDLKAAIMKLMSELDE